MSGPAISIVIPTLGDPEKLQRLLASIQKQKFLNVTEIIETIVVVNGMQAQESDFEFGPFVKFEFLAEKGVNMARNAGVRLAQAPIVLFLDDDCELHEPYFLSRHIAFHREHSSVFATGGGYQLPRGAGRLDEVYNSIQMRWFVSGLLQPGQNEKTRFLLGGNFSIKARMAQDRNLKFDEQIRYGGSESEFFKQAEILKLEVLTNSFDVLHHTGETLFSLSRKLYRQGRGKALIDEKFPESPAATETGALSCRIFNYVFWWGYYFSRKNYFGILPHVFNDALAAFNAARFRVVRWVSKRLAEKQEKGDRF